MVNPLGVVLNMVRGKESQPLSPLPGGLSLQSWLSLTTDGRGKPYGYSAAVREMLNHLRGYGTQDTITALAKYYPTSAARMIAVTLNVVRRVVYEQARVFEGTGQSFHLVDDAGEPADCCSAWAGLLERCEFERKLRETNRVTRACRRSFVRVTRDDRYGVDLTLFPPDAVFPLFYPDTNYNLDRSRGVLLRAADTWDDAGNRLERWEFWSTGLDADGNQVDTPRNFILERRAPGIGYFGGTSSDGPTSTGYFGASVGPGAGGVNVVKGPSGGENPYRREDGRPFVPIVTFSDEDDDFGYWLPPSEQLLTCARAINAMWTDLQHIARKQGHGQPYSEIAEGAGTVEEWPATVNANPDEPIPVPRGRRLSILNYNADLGKVLDIAKEFLREVTQLEGLPPGTVLAEGRQVPSGVALEIERIPLIEQRRDQVSMYRRPVHDLMESIRLIWNSGQESNTTRFLGVRPQWTEGTLSAPVDPEAIGRVNEQRIRQGLTSPARILADEDSSTLEEAQVKAAEIAAENKARVAASLEDVAESLRPAMDDAGAEAEEVEPVAAEPNADALLGPDGEKITFYQYELEGGVMTINEMRRAKGLPADQRYGNMTLPEYRAANAQTYAAATTTQTGGSAEKLTGLADE